ncbi:MAG: GTPase HflX, partial [Candidatus Krumholzibacteria bacterium]|nr:GTPase HflX [Candidatus Krumholzibacteria bacterium]
MIRSYHIPPPDSPEEKAFLVGVNLPGMKRRDETENLGELELLARTAGAEVAGHAVQRRTRIDGSTYIGEGKIRELAGTIYEQGINLVIFDDDLSPAQARNIENRLNVNVIDRTELILDIFARRARTRQAKIQVEIAQLTYALPRLRRLWDHLSRQAGGIGTRGPGETQIEVDRRRVRERIDHLNRALSKISRGVGERRKKRKALFNVTIVGYTNAGKSTLLNRLVGSSVVESGRLFSTLDSTTRRAKCPDGKVFLLTDTV